MADARLRELARWEQADLETQIRLLRERMRAGELSEDRVRLAAWLRDEASLGICQVMLREVDWEASRLRDSLIALGRPSGVCILQSLAVLELATLAELPALLPTSPFIGGAELAADTCRALGVWLNDSGQRTRQHLVKTNNRAERLRARALEQRRKEAGNGPKRRLTETEGRVCSALHLSGRAAHLIGSNAESQIPGIVANAINHLEREHFPEHDRALKRKVACWLLGLRDPVAERAAAREALRE